MIDIKRLSEVFPAVGKPTHTYVERDSGTYEKQLALGLSNPGQICLLTGPSKTGKTSLFRQVLPKIAKQELVIRCSGKMTPSEFWASALESLDFTRLSEFSNTHGINLTAKIGASGEVGWSWLAKAMATVGFDISAKGDYGIKKEVVRSAINSKHLIPLLCAMPIQLVVEDFHYLEDDAKKEIFQQWKAFTDEGVSVLVVSTTHHAIDIARANPDLSGRTRMIDVGQWEISDLAKIPEKGFAILGIKSTDRTRLAVARESVGLPIIAQQICQQIAAQHDMSPGSMQRSANIQMNEVSEAQRYVADTMYQNHKQDYDQLSAGPRQRRRKHSTYEKILASFALDPIRFSLSLPELLERVDTLRGEGEKIPQASINAALKALANFQQRKKMSLLEWHEGEGRLYIVEPSFLFYLRQKIDTVPGQDIVQKLTSLFELMEKNNGQLKFEMLLPNRESMKKR